MPLTWSQAFAPGRKLAPAGAGWKLHGSIPDHGALIDPRAIGEYAVDELPMVTAVIATLDEVDADGDTYDPGAFTGPGSDQVLLSTWQHGSWSPGQLPIGVGRIDEQDGKAVFTGLFAPTAAAREHFLVYRMLGGRIKWSFGYDVVRSREDYRGDRKVRVLQQLVVHECSGVMTPAGIGTGTTETSMTSPEALAAEYRRFQITCRQAAAIRAR